jgi:hypothetical protein
MARYVKEQLGAEPVRHQWDNLIKLCDGLTRIKKSTSWTPQGILPILWGGLDSNGNRTWASETIEVVLKSLSDSTRSEDMIMTAVLIGNVELVTEAMTSAPRDLPFAIFDSPIQNAVRLGNSGIFRAIIKVSEAEQSKSIKEHQRRVGLAVHHLWCSGSNIDSHQHGPSQHAKRATRLLPGSCLAT